MVENTRDPLADLSFTHQLLTLAAALESSSTEPDGANFASAAAQLRELAESQAADALAVIRRRSDRD